MIEIAKEQAQKAFRKGEVPVGAVIVRDGKIVAKKRNKKEKKQRAIKHAEILAIDKANKKLGSWRLDDCEMFVTHLPCPMCAGAIVGARIKKVTVGASNDEQPLIEKIFSENKQNHKTELVVLNDEGCTKLMKDFFKKLR